MAASPILKFANAKPARPKPKLGLRAWMERVLVECDRAALGFDADPVHDLRVALRRCRSLADGLMALDPDPSWKDMKKAGRKLFQALGELRDMQVMQEWIEKLSDPSDPVAIKLLNHVRAREVEYKQRAFKDLNQFDRKQWRQWTRTLPRRASRARPGSAVHLHLALEKWTAAYDLHKHALRSRSQAGWHELRIGIKRFRYTVENFLPRQHPLWGDDLKDLQDLLGEVHDLDVLWAMAVEADVNAFPDIENRNRWREKLTAERIRRIELSRRKMVGRQSLWRVWRVGLPMGPQLRAAAMSRLKAWAGYLDPDFLHSQRVAELALLLYDGLKDAGLLAVNSGTQEAGQQEFDRPRVVPPNPIHSNPAPPDLVPLDRDYDARAVLQAAAFLHDVGKAKGPENHQKNSYRMIRALPRPLGWSARELELTAVVARYHRGALPHPRGKTMQLLDLPDRPIAMELAGVLRLANALDTHHARNGRSGKEKENENANQPRLEVSLQDRFVVVRAAGYSALDRAAEGVAAARHLLETVLRRPVLVRALRASAERGKSATLSSSTRTL
jgi:CHAD domain-containing protein